jgi:putative ABC transport system substrate-binding protein
MITLSILLAVLILAAPSPAEAQQAGKTPTIGYLSPAAARNPLDDVFEQSLQKLGWVRDRNVRIERRYSGGRQEAFAPLAAELVHFGVDLLVAWSPAGALAAKRATSHIPVIFLAAGDPVGFGLVSSLGRPGGNVTGVSFDAAVETYAKRLQLLKEAVPSLTRVAVLAAEPRTTIGKQTITAAARVLKLELHDVEVRAPAELTVAVRTAKAQGAQALYIWPSGFAFSFRKQISELALANRLPSIHPFRENVIAGGLLSYAPSLTDIARRGGGVRGQDSQRLQARRSPGRATHHV